MRRIVNNRISGNGVLGNGVEETGRQGNVRIYFHSVTSELNYILHSIIYIFLEWAFIALMK